MSRWQSEEGDSLLDEEGELEGDWELDPNDPEHPDYDLSVSAGYGNWEPSPKPLLVRRGVMLLLSLLVILGLFIPLLVRLTF